MASANPHWKPAPKLPGYSVPKPNAGLEALPLLQDSFVAPSPKPGSDVAPHPPPKPGSAVAPHPPLEPKIVPRWKEEPAKNKAYAKLAPDIEKPESVVESEPSVNYSVPKSASGVMSSIAGTMAPKKGNLRSPPPLAAIAKAEDQYSTSGGSSSSSSKASPFSEGSSSNSKAAAPGEGAPSSFDMDFVCSSLLNLDPFSDDSKSSEVFNQMSSKAFDDFLTACSTGSSDAPQRLHFQHCLDVGFALLPSSMQARLKTKLQAHRFVILEDSDDNQEGRSTHSDRSRSRSRSGRTYNKASPSPKTNSMLEGSFGVADGNAWKAAPAEPGFGNFIEEQLFKQPPAITNGTHEQTFKQPTSGGPTSKPPFKGEPPSKGSFDRKADEVSFKAAPPFKAGSHAVVVPPLQSPPPKSPLPGWKMSSWEKPPPGHEDHNSMQQTGPSWLKDQNSSQQSASPWHNDQNSTRQSASPWHNDQPWHGDQKSERSWPGEQNSMQHSGPSWLNENSMQQSGQIDANMDLHQETPKDALQVAVPKGAAFSMEMDQLMNELEAAPTPAPKPEDNMDLEDYQTRILLDQVEQKKRQLEEKAREKQAAEEKRLKEAEAAQRKQLKEAQKKAEEEAKRRAELEEQRWQQEQERQFQLKAMQDQQRRAIQTSHIEANFAPQRPFMPQGFPAQRPAAPQQQQHQQQQQGMAPQQNPQMMQAMQQMFMMMGNRPPLGQ